MGRCPLLWSWGRAPATPRVYAYAGLMNMMPRLGVSYLKDVITRNFGSYIYKKSTRKRRADDDSLADDVLSRLQGRTSCFKRSV